MLNTNNQPTTEAEDTGDRYDLPFDSESIDIVCRREIIEGNASGENRLGEVRRLHFNIRPTVIHHSPSGWEWGYAGSGPSDFALNVLQLFVPGDDKGLPSVKCWRGTCSRFAWLHHIAFKNEFIARLPREGSVIEGATIRAWIAERQREDVARDEQTAHDDSDDTENDSELCVR
ncbi:MAG: hypothetical protein H0W76_07880 [Pyrinomonadaceae bacterium]|nr:hypothetical protein [Pyrinomonadaceae bacterium]